MVNDTGIIQSGRVFNQRVIHARLSLFTFLPNPGINIANQSDFRLATGHDGKSERLIKGKNTNFCHGKPV